MTQKRKKKTKLKDYFPKSGPSTRLVILSQALRLKVGGAPVELVFYPVGDGEGFYAAYVEESDTIYVRFVDFELAAMDLGGS